MSEHWSDNLTHEKLVTPEAKTVLSQYSSQDDFMVAGLEAKKMVGQPFRLPKSLDSLSDDNVRSEFTGGLSKLLGKDVTSIAGEDDLKDVNFAEGLADARHVNQDFVGAFKKFAVENKLPKSVVASLVKFNNGFAQQIMTVQAQAQQAKAQTDLDETRKALSPLFGGDEGIKQNMESVRRMFQNHAGLTADEFEKSAKNIIDNGILRDPVFAKALFNLSANFKEGTTEGAESQTGAPKKETLAERQDKALPIITGHLWPKKDKK